MIESTNVLALTFDPSWKSRTTGDEIKDVDQTGDKFTINAEQAFVAETEEILRGIREDLQKGRQDNRQRASFWQNRLWGWK